MKYYQIRSALRVGLNARNRMLVGDGKLKLVEVVGSRKEELELPLFVKT